MPLNLIFIQAGDYSLEDNEIPGDGISVIKDGNGVVIFTFAHPADSLGFTVSTPGVNITINLSDSLGAANFTLGSLTDVGVSPESIVVKTVNTTGTVTLVTNGSITEGGSDTAADITAGAIVLSAGTGIGTGGNAIETRTGLFEAETTTGGINIGNFGSVQVGGVVAEVDGIDVVTSGDINFSTVGSIFLTESNTVTAAEIVHGGSTSGNVFLTASGFNADIIGNVDNAAVTAARGSAVLSAGRDIQLGTIGADFNNDVIASNAVTFTAGRDILLDGFADVLSDNFGLNTGGDLTFTAGRNIGILQLAGTSASATASGSAGGDVILTTGVDGVLTVNGPGSFGVGSTSGTVTVNADRILIDAASGISAPSGQVAIRPRTPGREMILGSASDAALAVELSNTEIGRIFSPTVTLGSDATGNVRVVGDITPTIANLIVRSGEDIYLAGGISTSDSISLIAGNSMYYQSGTISTGTLQVQVDNLGDDGGVGGMGRLGAISPSGTPNALSVVLNGNGDADILRGAEGIDQTVHGNGGNDIITSSGEGRYFGDNGNDTIFAGLSSGLVPEVLDGGAGVDTLDTTSFVGNYTINLATGTSNFSFESFLNFENVTTGSGNDTITGTAAANVILTGQGNDTLNGGGGADAMAGGQGDDTYYVDSFFDSVIEAIGEGNDTLITSASFALGSGQEVELMRTPGSATTSSINLTGNAFVQMLLGNAGANVLNGGGGADTLRGYGGDDTYWIDNAGEVLIEAAGQGTDTAITSVSYALAAGVSVEVLRTLGSGTTDVIDLTGNAFVQMLLGNAAANVLDGGGGADTLRGYGGNDTYRIDNAGDVLIEAVGQGTDTAITTVSYTLAAGVSVEVLRTTGSSGTGAIDLTGNEQNQTLAGNAAANVLRGGDGNDVLWGYLGNDELTGGAGSDTMVFSTALGPGNVDLIHGYVVADDSIMIDNAVFTGLAEGALAAGAFRVGAAAVDADDRILYNSVTGELLFDVDGVGGAAAVVFADMSAGLAMTNAEFLVI